MENHSLLPELTAKEEKLMRYCMEAIGKMGVELCKVGDDLSSLAVALRSTDSETALLLRENNHQILDVLNLSMESLSTVMDIIMERRGEAAQP